ncbi:hypothetical protein ACHMW7_17510 [Aminobacter sp. UC22_36]|uniref:hypothetical protein n=1 Tax=Aminobacter sp. UC22_36 TaxID=3374549 RepID=UPI003756EEB9
MPKVGILDETDTRCDFLGIKPYNKLKCDPGEQKEHTVEVQFFTAGGVRNLVLKCCEKYDDRTAPCICMKAKWVAGEGAAAREAGVEGRSVLGRTTNTPHYYKSAEARNWIADNPEGKLGDFVNTCVAATVENLDLPPSQVAIATECLEVANMNYLKKNLDKDEQAVKDKQMCHTTCTRAYAEEERVAAAKKKLKKPTVSARQVEKVMKQRPTVGCKRRAGT